MRNHTRRRPLLTLLAVASMIVGLYAGPAPVAQTTGRAALRDLRGLDELKTMFNQDGGKVRLVLLLSPT